MCAAMAVAQELFDPVHAVRCLDFAEERLLGSTGVRTLNRADECFRLRDENAVESEEFATSRVFNYHNGPQWLRPAWFFLRASVWFRRGVKERMKNIII